MRLWRMKAFLLKSSDACSGPSGEGFTAARNCLCAWMSEKLKDLEVMSIRLFQRHPGTCTSTHERDCHLLEYTGLHNRNRTELVKLLSFAQKSFFSGNQHLSPYGWLPSWYCMCIYCVAKADMFIWSWVASPLLNDVLWHRHGLFFFFFHFSFEKVPQNHDHPWSVGIVFEH